MSCSVKLSTVYQRNIFVFVSCNLLMSLIKLLSNLGPKQKSSLFKKYSNLQKRTCFKDHIIFFSRFDCPSEHIFKYYKILKLNDEMSLYNCLLIHDYSRKRIPPSSDTYFRPCAELHNNDTWRQAGCVFVPHHNSKRYGRQSIKLSRILN